MRLHAICLYTILVLCLGCDSGEEEPAPVPVPTTLLTLKVEDTYPVSSSGHWVVIHDNNGEVLDYRPLDTSEELVIQTDKILSADPISVTIIRHDSWGDNKTYVITTYTNVEKGKTMTLKMNPNLQSLESDGTFSVNVTDFGSVDQFTLATNQGLHGNGSWNSTTLTAEASVHKASPNSILQLSNQETIKYTTIDNPKVGSTYDISFNDMLPFDHTIQFSFPATDAAVLFVRGREPGLPIWAPGYALNAHYAVDIHTSIKAGYLNSLKNYTTFLHLSYPGYMYIYNNFGFIPDPNINWPNPANFIFTSKSINNFSATTPTLAWRRSYWQYFNANAPGMHSVHWTVYSPSKTQLVKELPAEIVSNHPLLSFGNLRHVETTFFTEAQPYTEFITRTFKGDFGNNGAEVGINFLN